MRLTSGDAKTLVAIAGRQIVSKDGLEVLALGTRQPFDEGQPTRTLIQKVARAGALPVLPWGVGKWMGTRGKRVTQLLRDRSMPRFFIGDNGNRPRFWSRPEQFRLARERDVGNLPGSDPLPFAGEVRQMGSYGLVLDGSIALERPAQDLKRRLLDRSTALRRFGKREKTFRFLRNQFKMQLRKLMR